MFTTFPLIPSVLCATLYINGSQRSSFGVVKYDADNNYIDVMRNIMIRERERENLYSYIRYIYREEGGTYACRSNNLGYICK